MKVLVKKNKKQLGKMRIQKITREEKSTKITPTPPFVKDQEPVISITKWLRQMKRKRNLNALAVRPVAQRFSDFGLLFL